MLNVTLEFDRKETNELKEKYGKGDNLVQLLFDRFYMQNWHLPNEITAVRELLFEKTGVKVVKPELNRTLLGDFDPLFGRQFDWSYYDSEEEKKQKTMRIPKEELIELVEDTYVDYIATGDSENGIVDYILSEIGNYLVNRPENQKIACETLLSCLAYNKESYAYKEVTDILSKLNQK